MEINFQFESNRFENLDDLFASLHYHGDVVLVPGHGDFESIGVCINARSKVNLDGVEEAIVAETFEFIDEESHFGGEGVEVF